MVDAAMQRAALKGSIDNLTIVVICSKVFKEFFMQSDGLNSIKEAE